MITILTWYWRQPGGRTDYLPAHVNIWADMVRRNLAMPHRIACVTDEPAGIDRSIEIIVPPREFEHVTIPTWGRKKPQCLRRLAMFRHDAADLFGERFVCMDLDVVIAGPLDPLFSGADDFRIFRGTGGGRPYNGSMMMIRAGARAEVYDRFTPEGAAEAGRHFLGSDQAWITYALGPNEPTWGIEHGVHFWDWKRPIGDVAVLFFPGEVKPWEIVHGDRWVATHYRRSPRGRCLILGYAPSVWDDAAEVLQAGAFDAVIVSPEAAAEWPGDVLAVAANDADAERLAVMHGFDDIVFCGRTWEREAA